jgi:RNA polymerase sigma factor (sigma-70 family)
MSTDAELLRQYAEEHHEAAFAELVRRHVGVIYHAALRRVNDNQHLAAEATQLVFTQLARKARRLSAHPAILGWLHTSTRYAASALVRREVRRAAHEHLAATMNSEVSAAAAVPWETLRPLIDAALDRLSAPDRQAVLLRYFSGQSFAEIGAALDVSEEASRKRVERALENLRGQFARHGITTSAAALAAALGEATAAEAPVALASTVASAATAAAADGSAAAVLIGLMSNIKLLAIALAVCSIAGLATIGTTVAIWSQQERERGQLVASMAQAAAFRGRLDQRERLAQASRSAAPATRAPSPNTTTAPRPDRIVSDNVRWQQMMANSRDYAPFREKTFRLKVQGAFGAFLATRNLLPEKQELIRKALAAYFAAEEDATTAYLAATEGSGQPLKTTMEKLTNRLFDELRPQIGDEETEQLRRFYSARRWLPEARNVAMDMADAGHPLSDTQIAALAMVIADANAPATPAARDQQLAVDPATGLTFKEAAQLDDATVFLTPTQVPLFEEYVREERARGELTARVRSQFQPPSP